MRRALVLVVCLFVFLMAVAAQAGEIVVQGGMDANMDFVFHRTVAFPGGASRVECSFVAPKGFVSTTYTQDVKDFSLEFSPKPDKRTSRTDARGNEIITAQWSDPPRAVEMTYAAKTKSVTRLDRITTDAAFPLPSVPRDVSPYLGATPLVQADDPVIQQTARALTQGAATEYEAASKVVNWVADHVRYVSSPKSYGALYSLESGRGNCQNYSHLTAALLRAVGVPVRIVNGFTVKNPYSVRAENITYTFKAGQGRHSWIEVWFPDLGWIPFDPQKTSLFVSNRFLRIEVGLDNKETQNDGRIRWVSKSGSERPKLNTVTTAELPADVVKLSGRTREAELRNILLYPDVAETAVASRTSAPAAKPAASEPAAPAPSPQKALVPPVHPAPAAKPAAESEPPSKPKPAASAAARGETPPAPALQAKPADEPQPPRASQAAPAPSPPEASAAPAHPKPAAESERPKSFPEPKPAAGKNEATPEPALKPTPKPPSEADRTGTPAKPEPSPEPAPEAQLPEAARPKPAAPAPQPGQAAVIGNLDFPENVDFADYGEPVKVGAHAYELTRNFMVETAEYVTTQATQFAQAVALERPLRLTRIGLALHRYGGNGSLWVEVYEDAGGQPGELLATSELLDPRLLSLKPGYRWADFSFRDEPASLRPGVYWIALAFTGDPIVNWFYTPGKSIGPSWGTRYKGVFDPSWSGALDFEFNYRLKGVYQ
jgi:hypothetical protein